MKRAVLLLLVFPAVVFAGGDVPAPPVQSLQLAQIERELLESSPRYRAAVREEQAAMFRAASQEALLYPKAVLEGSYRYLTVIPELTPAVPGAANVKLGDNTNYSLGPAVYWTVWDHGALRSSWQSAQAAAQAKRQNTELARRQLILAGRTAYFQVALKSEQVAELAGSVQLANNQYNDITARARAGEKTRLDVLSAHQDLLARQQQLSQARADLAGALRDLAALTGARIDGEISVPLDSRVPASAARLFPPATVMVSAEPLEQLLAHMADGARGGVSASNPAVAEPNRLAESSELTARSITSGLWPKIQISAKTSLDYPNGPTPETINQNSAGATLNWPLFEAGASRKRAADSRNMQQAYGGRAEQALADLRRDWGKTRDQLENLGYQEKLGRQGVAEAAEAARIAYDAYRAGSRTYIDVQNANLRLLDARLQLSRIRVQMLNNYAVAASLAD